MATDVERYETSVGRDGVSEKRPCVGISRGDFVGRRRTYGE